VMGIGEKTAIALIQKFGTLENIYQNLNQVEKRWVTKLAQNRETAYLSRNLAQIRTDLNIKLDLTRAKTDGINIPALEALFTELEFRSLIKTLDRLSGKETSTPARSTQKAGQQMSMFANEPQQIIQTTVPLDIDVNIVDTTEKLDKLVKELGKASVISFDTETTSTVEMQAEIVGISLSIKEGEGYYIPVGHNAGTNLPLEQVLAALKRPLTDPKIGKIAHNAKYDYIVLARNGLRVSPLTFDTMLAEFIIDPASRNMGLKNLASPSLARK